MAFADVVPRVEWSKKFTLPREQRGVKFHTRNNEKQNEVAPKFKLTQIVQIPKARQMAFNEAGDVMFVGSRHANDYTPVYAVLLSRKASHIHEGVQQYDIEVTNVYTITENMAMPSGIAYDDETDTLYVGIVTGIMRYQEAIKRLRQDPGKKLTGDMIFATPNGKINSWKYLKIARDSDGSKRLLFPIGSPCDSCVEDLPYSTINMINLDGNEYVPLVRGVRNSVGFAMQPGTEGTLWFTDCAQDARSAPCDELNKLDDLFGHAKTVNNNTMPSYGFPFCDGLNKPNEVHNPSGKCDDFISAEYCLGVHVASLGMTFYDAKKHKLMPKELVGTGQSVSIIAEHGSWNRDPKSGYRVTTVDVGDTNSGSYQTFIDGFDTLEPNGRPVDIAVYSQDGGSIFISDDSRDAVYRVTYGYVPGGGGDNNDDDISMAVSGPSAGSMLVAMVTMSLAVILAILLY